MNKDEKVFEGTIVSIAYRKAGDGANDPNHEAMQVSVRLNEPVEFGSKKMYQITDWLKVDTEHDYSFTRWTSLAGVTDGDQAKQFMMSKNVFDLIGLRVKVGCEEKGTFNDMPSFSVRRVLNQPSESAAPTNTQQTIASAPDDDIPF